MVCCGKPIGEQARLGHLGIWASGHLGVGQTPGTDTPGTLGTSQLGQSQGRGTNGHLEDPAARTLEACFHSPVERGHSARWATLPRRDKVLFRRRRCQRLHVREPGAQRTEQGAGLWPAHLGKLLQA